MKMLHFFYARCIKNNLEHMTGYELLNAKGWQKYILAGTMGAVALAAAGGLVEKADASAQMDNALDRLEIVLQDYDTGNGIANSELRVYNLDDKTIFDQTRTTDSEGSAVFENYTYVDQDNTLVPLDFAIEQNYPNPFNPSTVIPFSTETEGDIDINIYNIRGELVKELTDAWLPAGKHKVGWSGTDNKGQGVASGVYIAEVRSNGERKAMKMTLVDGSGKASFLDGIRTEYTDAARLSKTQAEDDYVIETSPDNYESLTDTVKLSGGEERLIYALTKNQAPVAYVTADPDTGTIDTIFNLDGSQSSDDKKIIKYEWDFGNGFFEGEEQEQHQYQTKGEKTVVLRVSDEQGKTNSDTARVYLKNKTPEVSLEDISFKEDSKGKSITLNVNDDDDEHIYEIINQTNPDLVTYKVEDGKLTLESLAKDQSGHSDITIRVSDFSGAYSEANVRVSVEPEADITATFKDPINKELVKALDVMFGDYAITTDENGRVAIQVAPGQYKMQTDSSGGRMMTEWDLDIGTEDMNLDSLLKDTPLKAVPVAWKNDEQMALVINAHGVYGDSDRETYVQNKIWDPEKKYGEELPKGTLRTVYVNTSNTDGFPVTQENLDWLIDKVPESTDNLIRLQTRAEADSVYIEANNGAEESYIVGNFMAGNILQDYDYMVLISTYSPSVNGSDANSIPDGEHTSKGFARINRGDLGTPRRAGGLSEVTTSLQNGEDVTNEMEDAAAGTMYGDTREMNHEQGYVASVSYGPPGNQIQISPEHHLGALTLNIPLDSIIKKEKLELPKPE
ncbi:MAG: PKD domain-containing protein [candidate division KSB1 bacterium]|nr:PKD domain-containing protein [candidate division KSB1 bacterium]